MKKTILIAFTFLITGIFQNISANSIKWMSWEEAITANSKEQKLIFVDVYTAWCGWCKVMDRNTFTDSLVIDYMNKHFYCVKFDAEQKADVKYKDNIFRYNPNYKSHDLAVSLLNGQMSYPSFVVLSKKEERITILKGYQEAGVFLANLKAIVDSQK